MTNRLTDVNKQYRRATMFADPIMDQLIRDLIWQRKWTARLQIGLMCLCVVVIVAYILKNCY